MKSTFIRRSAIALGFAATAATATSSCSNKQKSTSTKEGDPAAASASSGVRQATLPAAAMRQQLAGGKALDAGALGADKGALDPDVAATNATELVLATASRDCLACARALAPSTQCDLGSHACETLPAGRAREQCLDTLRCVLSQGSHPSCVNKTNSNLTACYCGTASVESCLSSGKANGSCKRSIETGLGSADPSFVAQNMTNPTQPSGLAMKLAQCLADAGRLADPKCQSCF